VSDATAPISPRPAERDALLNPPLIALVLAHAARGQHKRTERPHGAVLVLSRRTDRAARTDTRRASTQGDGEVRRLA
jgi:hypothetical protein